MEKAKISWDKDIVVAFGVQCVKSREARLSDGPSLLITVLLLDFKFLPTTRHLLNTTLEPDDMVA